MDGALDPRFTRRYPGRALRVIHAIRGGRPLSFISGSRRLDIPSHDRLGLVSRLTVLDVAQEYFDQGVQAVRNNKWMHVLDVVFVGLNICPDFILREVP